MPLCVLCVLLLSPTAQESCLAELHYGLALHETPPLALTPYTLGSVLFLFFILSLSFSLSVSGVRPVTLSFTIFSFSLAICFIRNPHLAHTSRQSM